MQDKDVTFIVLGATGNLAFLKIWPAFCSLFEKNKLGTNPQFIAFGRKKMTRALFCESIRAGLGTYDDVTISRFFAHIEYCEGDLQDANSFVQLKDKIKHHNVFTHFCITPEYYRTVIQNIGNASIATKILLEKPFGKSSEDAKGLFEIIKKYFSPDSVYLVDHYLGKKGLRTIIEKRINDPLFDTELNNQSISSLECHFFEDFGIHNRGGFYDNTGAYLDVGGNHILLMLLAFIEKKENLKIGVWGKALSLLSHPHIFVTGQYEGYLSEKDIPSSSLTETYFKIKLQTEDALWQGVDIVLEGGKELCVKKSEVIVSFKDGTKEVFDIDGDRGYNSYEAIFEAIIGGASGFTLSMTDILAFNAFNDRVLSMKPQKPIIYKKGVCEVISPSK